MEDDASLLAVPESIDRYDDAGIAEDSPSPTIRKEFPESWIYDSFDGYDDGSFLPVFSLLSLLGTLYFLSVCRLFLVDYEEEKEILFMFPLNLKP